MDAQVRRAKTKQSLNKTGGTTKGPDDQKCRARARHEEPVDRLLCGPALAALGESRPPARARDFSLDPGRKSQKYREYFEIFERRDSGKRPHGVRFDFCHALLGSFPGIRGAPRQHEWNVVDPAATVSHSYSWCGPPILGIESIVKAGFFGSLE